jgi:hypothetical protein
MSGYGSGAGKRPSDSRCQQDRASSNDGATGGKELAVADLFSRQSAWTRSKNRVK